jgi:hypothetical protein
MNGYGLEVFDRHRPSRRQRECQRHIPPMVERYS